MLLQCRSSVQSSCRNTLISFLLLVCRHSALWYLCTYLFSYLMAGMVPCDTFGHIISFMLFLLVSKVNKVRINQWLTVKSPNKKICLYRSTRCIPHIQMLLPWQLSETQRRPQASLTHIYLAGGKWMCQLLLSTLQPTMGSWKSKFYVKPNKVQPLLMVTPYLRSPHLSSQLIPRPSQIAL